MACDELTRAQRLVLLALETFANYSDGTGARPGVALLAEKSGLKDRAVKAALVRGREIGLIEVRRGARKLGHADTYRLLPDHTSKCTGVHLEPISKCTATTFLSAPPCTPPFQAPLTTKKEPLRGCKDGNETFSAAGRSGASDPGFFEEPTREETMKHDHDQDGIPGGLIPLPTNRLPAVPDSPPAAPDNLPAEQSRSARGTRLPDGWMPPPEVVAQMRAECPHVDQKLEHRKFCDYWADQPGAKGRKVNWVGTYRNWIRKAAEDRQPQGRGRNGLSAVDEKALGWQGVGR